jgi:hypothetical protein
MRKRNWPQSAAASGGVMSAEPQPMESLPIRSGAELVSAVAANPATRTNISNED